MKKSFYALLMTSLVMLVWLLVSISYGATDKAGGVKAKAANIKEPQYGGTISFARPIPPITWDNAEWQWKHGQDTGFYIEHLMMGDLQKGPRGTNQFVFRGIDGVPAQFLRGELMERWEVKKNPLQLILYLRKGIMWQEKPGIMKAREFVADDVVYSITRLKNAKKAPPGRLDFVGKMETPDKYTVIINMPQWCADWPLYLGWGYYEGIQAPEQEKAPGGPGKWENACGTGPFMITDYKDGHSQTYTKNPNYWDSEVIKGKKYKLPFVDQVYIPIVKNEQTELSLFRSGKLDIINQLNWQEVAGLKKTNPQLKWGRYPSMLSFTLCLRMDKKPFNDIRVRRALNLAINKKEILDSFFQGNAELYSYPFPRELNDIYTPVEKLSPSARELFTYNPEKAKKLLAEAGYPNGLTFNAQIQNNVQEYLDLAQLLVAYLDRIGVKLVLEPMDYNSWLTTMLKKTHKEAIFLASGPASALYSIWKSYRTGSVWNPHMMSDPYLDKACIDALENPNNTERQSLEIIKKLGVYVLEQAPAVILPTVYYYVVWWPWVQNYYGEQRVGAQRDAPIYARIWIDQEMKKKMGY